jgi:Radical SAM superfamily
MNQPIEGRPGRYWHILEDHRIQCDVCPRYCKLHEGQRGLCFVRARQGDQMVLTTYGRSSGFCIDPIEKKPLNHFLPGSPVLSFGTAGCNLTCKFCQNWDISKARNFDRIQDLASPEAIALAALRSSCPAVAFTYNDPVIFLEYAVDVAQACRERGIKTVAVSAGYVSPEPRIEFFRHMDATNIDLKGFTDGFYKNLCSGKLAPVLDGSPGPRRAVTFHCLPSGLEVDGQTADTAADPAHGAADRHERRPSLCLYRQCSRFRRPGHALSRLRRGADRPRLVRHHSVASVCGRPMCQV